MALAAPLERLQPCLFDRLLDEEPEHKQESRNARIISLARYRDGILRDLAWLLNCSAHLSDEGLSEFPEVEKSVMNFGKRGLAGMVASDVDGHEMEEEIARTILQFEPRIVPETLSVSLVTNADGRNPNVLAFEIKGELWAQPFPEKLFIKTSLDIENGTVEL